MNFMSYIYVSGYIICCLAAHNVLIKCTHMFLVGVTSAVAITTTGKQASFPSSHDITVHINTISKHNNPFCYNRCICLDEIISDTFWRHYI